MDLYLAMRRALADTFVFYYKAHAAHWNVIGDNFPQYHKFLDDLNGELFEAVDPLAEHIRAIGGMATESLAAILADATVSEFEMAVSSPAVIFNELYQANEQTIDSLSGAYVQANKENKLGLANFLQDRLDVHAKHGWFIRSIMGAQ